MPKTRADAASSTDPVSRGSVVLAEVLDEIIRVPGTRWRFGIDPILALIPGIGDAAGTAMSGLILVDAIRYRIPLPVVGRMIVNVAIDMVVGLVPVLGFFFSAGWKSNSRNIRLMRATLNDREQARQSSRTYLVVALAMVIGSVVLLIAAAISSALLIIWGLAQILGLN